MHIHTLHALNRAIHQSCDHPPKPQKETTLEHYPAQFSLRLEALAQAREVFSLKRAPFA